MTTQQVVTCAGCTSRLKTKPEFAGKTLKCPKCGQPVKVPAAAPLPEAEDDWIDITEAYGRPEAEADSTPVPRALASAPPAGGWGEDLLVEQEVPDDMREQVREALTKGEHVTWAARPLLDVLMHRAGKQRLVGVLVICGATIVPPIGAYLLFGLGVTGATIAACLLLFMMIVLEAVGLFMLGAPGRTRKNAGRRSCYMLTNRRLVIHPGTGTQSHVSRAGNEASVNFGADAMGVTSYSGMELLALRRNEDKAFPGTGELILGRDLFDEPHGGVLIAMDDVVNLEKRIREQLIHPVIDKLLQGEVVVKEGIGRQKEGGGEVMPTEGNLKDYAKDDLPTEGNVKTRKSPLEESLKSADKELRARVEAELTESERLLWMGKPEGKAKGRGMVGAVTGSAHPVEPEYHLYALTSHRVILWDKKGTKDVTFAFGNEDRGPISYYPPQVLDAVTEDGRNADEGSIVFKRVKLTITTTNEKGKESVRKELHTFGLLRIRNYPAVARSLFNTLIRPVRRK